MCLASQPWRPIVALSALSGGEMAILKGLGRVKSIALLSLLTALATLLITTAAYLLWGLSGVLPALCLSAWGNSPDTPHEPSCSALPRAVALVVCSWKRGWKNRTNSDSPYAIAGFIMMGGEWIVRIIIMRFSPFTEPMQRTRGGGHLCCWLCTHGFLLTLALYGNGCRLFSAPFCRYHRSYASNIAVNRQIDVLVQLATPSILLFCCLASLARPPAL